VGWLLLGILPKLRYSFTPRATNTEFWSLQLLALKDLGSAEKTWKCLLIKIQAQRVEIFVIIQRSCYIKAHVRLSNWNDKFACAVNLYDRLEKDRNSLLLITTCLASLSPTGFGALHLEVRKAFAFFYKCCGALRLPSWFYVKGLLNIKCKVFAQKVLNPCR
jgi:hypothetical protein